MTYTASLLNDFNPKDYLDFFDGIVSIIPIIMGIVSIVFIFVFVFTFIMIVRAKNKLSTKNFRPEQSILLKNLSNELDKITEAKDQTIYNETKNQTIPEKKYIICTYCKSRNIEDDDKCKNCGAPLHKE